MDHLDKTLVTWKVTVLLLVLHPCDFILTLYESLCSHVTALGHGGHVGQDGLEHAGHALGAAGVVVEHAQDAAVRLALHLLGVGDGRNPKRVNWHNLGT